MGCRRPGLAVSFYCPYEALHQIGSRDLKNVIFALAGHFHMAQVSSGTGSECHKGQVTSATLAACFFKWEIIELIML